MPRPTRFTIRAASALTGINPNTLRAWERRHRLVVPERSPKGYRLYTEDDIERLREIRHAIEHGVPVGHVRSHLEGGSVLSLPRPSATRAFEVSLESAGLTGTTTIHLPSGSRAAGAPTLEDLAEAFERAAHRLDRAALERTYGRAVGLYSLRHAFHDALAPALRRVGGRYLAGLAGVAEEHLLTCFAREKVNAALGGLRPLHQQPRALLACVPGEQHDLMLMLLALEIGLDGASVLFLGAGTPVEAVVHAAAESGVHVVALSATLRLPQDDLLDIHRRLASLPREPRLLVGGPAAVARRAWLEQSGIGVLPLDVGEAAARVLQGIRRR